MCPFSYWITENSSKYKQIVCSISCADLCKFMSNQTTAVHRKFMIPIKTEAFKNYCCWLNGFCLCKCNFQYFSNRDNTSLATHSLGSLKPRIIWFLGTQMSMNKFHWYLPKSYHLLQKLILLQKRRCQTKCHETQSNVSPYIVRHINFGILKPWLQTCWYQFAQ